jgi:hypothetical protein
MQSHFAQLRNMRPIAVGSHHVRIGKIKSRIHHKWPYNSLHIEGPFGRGTFRECRREIGNYASALMPPLRQSAVIGCTVSLKARP